MIDIDVSAVLVVLVRFANAVIWTAVIYRIIRNDIPLTRLVRQLLALVLGAGMWVLVVNGILTVLMIPNGPQGPQRFIYTAYTAMAAIIAVAIYMEEPDES